MGRHRIEPLGIKRNAKAGRGLLVAAVALLVAGTVAAVVGNLGSAPQTRLRMSGTESRAGIAPIKHRCAHTLTVVAASSFARPLKRIAAPLASAANCVAVQVKVADGRSAGDTVAAAGADVWIPDNTNWATLPGPPKLATGRNAGTILATSPLYFVTLRSGPALPAAADSWLGLAELLAKEAQWRLVLRDPVASGDGMVAAGGIAEAEYAAHGPLISALDLLRMWKAGTTRTAVGPALPDTPDQVGIVPEYALPAAARTNKYAFTAPTDGTSLLRYAWYPIAAAMADPVRKAAIFRLYKALTARSAATELSAAGLRAPNGAAAKPALAGLPKITAPPMAALSEHFTYHVLATWRPALRTSNMLLVIDVSGSMADPAPGTKRPKIGLVRQGVTQVDALLPDTALLGLWQFGSRLAPPHDWQQLVAPAVLSNEQRAAIIRAGSALHSRSTGTGLYDTILAAYRNQQAHYRAGMPNEVVLFTDGVNEDDPGSISLAQLQAGLDGSDPHRRVQLSIFGIGSHVPAAALTAAIAPVGGQVDLLGSPDEVIGAFVHAVSGALSGVPG